ncbi:hypothetical protein F2Q70_00039124 [Brassica cretica]|uniref:Aspartic peptidase DDI1-type domain-containing protein n=1 Tax=Brassica cretica TaxID=69181 RepID=A0A8S9K751_BRACR|nr:hypothetical protein F2Q70_00039124 [Brassica cretica]
MNAIIEYDFLQVVKEDKCHEAIERRTFRRRKEKVPKHLKRGANDKEMDNFTKRILRNPMDNPFEEAYFTHRLWMFFRETKGTEEDIRRMFHQVREKLRKRITLKKKSDPGMFVVPCLIIGIDYPSALCDTGSSVSILPKRNFRGIIRNLDMQIGNALVPVDFHCPRHQAQLEFFSTTWIFGASTRDDHRARPSVDIEEQISIDVHIRTSIDSEARRKLVWYMPSSTRSNKETELLCSPDPASLERSIRKEVCSSSIDSTTSSSIDFCQPPST